MKTKAVPLPVDLVATLDLIALSRKTSRAAVAENLLRPMIAKLVSGEVIPAPTPAPAVSPAIEARACDILDVIANHGEQTAADLCALLGVSRITLDAALNHLLRDGSVVKRPGRRKPGRPGAPPIVFSLP